jgi:archaellum component FlaC
MTIEKDLEKTTLATFNVKLVEWEKFKDMAKKDGRPASYFLNEFIKESISKGSMGLGNDTESISPIDTSDVKKLRSEFENAIATVKNELGQVQDQFLKYLETKLENQLREVKSEFANKLGDFRSEVADTAITDGTMRSAIAPLIEEIENLKKLDGIE